MKSTSEIQDEINALGTSKKGEKTDLDLEMLNSLGKCTDVRDLYLLRESILKGVELMANNGPFPGVRRDLIDYIDEVHRCKFYIARIDATIEHLERSGVFLAQIKTQQ